MKQAELQDLRNISLPAGTFISVNCEELFETLTKCWKDDPAVKRSSDPMAPLKHPAYAFIIKSGRAMIPHILRDYEESGAPWAIALTQSLGRVP